MTRMSQTARNCRCGAAAEDNARLTVAMFRKRRKTKAGRAEIPVPSELPPVVGLDEADEYAPGRRPRTWLWTLLAALVAVLLAVYLVVLGAKAIYDGLKDRGIANQQAARDHYALGMAHLDAGEYELAVAELELALRYDSSLAEAKTQLSEAEAKARAQVTPTSEARLDAAALLYKQAVTAYESGKLAEAVTALDKLHSLDGDYQRQNVETMLTTAHYQLGLDAVRGDRLDEAGQHFEAVLALKPNDGDARDQLNLVNLYKAALSNWDQNWPATIQALKGLYALAPATRTCVSVSTTLTHTWRRPIPRRATGAPLQRNTRRQSRPYPWKRQWTGVTTPHSGARPRPKPHLLRLHRGPNPRLPAQ